MEQNKPQSWHVYAGTYGGGKEQRLFRFSLECPTGAMELLEGRDGIENPSFAALNSAQTRLYAVSETGEPDCSVICYALDRTGPLFSYMNKESTRGGIPCFVFLDETNRCLLVANYTGGSVALYPIMEDGAIGPLADYHRHEGTGATERQQAPHPHSIVMDPGNRFACVPDLGLDKIVIYRLDPTAMKLIPHSEVALQSGAGPRHLAFNRAGDTAYVINELDSTVCVLAFDPDAGSMELLQTITTLPDDFEGENYCADIHLAPSGNYLYGSNRGHDSLVVYRVHPSDGKLELQEIVPTEGHFPRNFALSPDGGFLLAANQETDNIVAFKVDTATGSLKATGQELRLPKPVFLKIVPVG